VGTRLLAQCPHGSYFHAEGLPFTDDSGYEVVGFCCRRPRRGDAASLDRDARYASARSDEARSECGWRR
jgi:hypothetical protein